MATWQSVLLSGALHQRGRKGPPVTLPGKLLPVDTHTAVGGVVMSAGHGAQYAHLLLQGQELLIHLREWHPLGLYAVGAARAVGEEGAGVAVVALVLAIVFVLLAAVIPWNSPLHIGCKVLLQARQQLLLQAVTESLM